MEEMEAITIVNEDGEEFDFAVDRLLEYNGQSYAVLVPLEETAEDEESEADEPEAEPEVAVEEDAEDIEDCAVIFRIEKDEKGEEVLVDIDDDDEFKSVSEEYYRLVDEGDDETE